MQNMALCRIYALCLYRCSKKFNLVYYCHSIAGFSPLFIVSSPFVQDCKLVEYLYTPGESAAKVKFLI